MEQFDQAFFDQELDRKGTNSVKWSKPGVCPEGHIPLWVADMDFVCAPAITQALTERTKHPSYGYTFISDDDTEALCSWWERRHGVSFLPEHVGFLPSVVTGLRVTLEEFTRVGEGVIIQSPVYGPFFSTIVQAERIVLEARLQQDKGGRYHMDLHAVEAFLKQGAKLMVLCNPQNPVGRAWRQEELTALVSLLEQYDCALVSDEIHADFVYSPSQFISALNLGYQKLVVLASASKTFNLPGLQQSNLICKNKEILKSMEDKLERSGVECGNIFALVATRAAYHDADAWLDGLLDYLSESRDVLKNKLSELLPQAKLTPIEASYLAWVDMRAYGLSNQELYRRCEEKLVLLVSGQFFGKNAGEGFMRINFGCPRAQLLEGLERFADAVKG